MRSRLDILLDLLHTGADAALSTHSVALPGFPFGSTVQFVADAQQRPIFLISRLAEHTQNLLHDDRASLLLHQPGVGAELARATVVGHAQPIAADDLLIARYVRYQPEAERFLQLGDFRFYRLEPLRIRIIGGFAQAGWLEGARLLSTPALPLADEAALIERCQDQLPDRVALLGIDPFGIDIVRAGRRERLRFDAGPLLGEAIGPAVARSLAGRE